MGEQNWPLGTARGNLRATVQAVQLLATSSGVLPPLYCPLCTSILAVGRVEDPVSSCYRLDCPSPLTSLHYNPKNPHLVAGGSYNGQLSWWDLRMAGSQSVAIEESHKDPVYSTRWTNSKTATEIVTASADGTVKWWDLRNMARANKTLVVDVLNRDDGNMGDIGSAQAVSSLEYTPTIPTR